MCVLGKKLLLYYIIFSQRATCDECAPMQCVLLEKRVPTYLIIYNVEYTVYSRTHIHTERYVPTHLYYIILYYSAYIHVCVCVCVCIRQ